MADHGAGILEGSSPAEGWNPLPGDAWVWWDGRQFVALSVGTAAPDHHRELIEDWGARPVPNPQPGWNPVPSHPDTWALFDSRGFPLIAQRNDQGWVFIHNARIDLPLPWARRARRWLIAWSVVVFLTFFATIVTSLWAVSAGSGTPANPPCSAADPRGVVAWGVTMLLSIALASAAIPLFLWARRSFIRSERRGWVIGMSIGGSFLVLGMFAMPFMFVLTGVSCGL